MRVTNETGIPLALAVWLLHDEYDYINEPNYVSVTSLMRPIKQLVLGSRVPYADRVDDVEDYVARGLGKAIHDSIEKAWQHGNHRKPLKLMGFPDQLIDLVKVNPTFEELEEDTIPVYLEQRLLAEFMGFKIGGKFDMVAEGSVKDNKSTSVNSFIFGSRDDEHRLQMSLYRWLDSKQKHQIITEDFGQINYIFTDWSKMMARQQGDKYPPKRTMEKQVALLSLGDTESWVQNKLTQYIQYHKAPESQMPECTDEELWRSEPKFKYYSDPTKTSGRSNKNFDDLNEANRHCATMGKGIVITQPGEVKRCPYCPAYDICEQRKRYFPDE